MSHAEVFPVPESVARASHCDNAKYLEMYQRSLDDPDGFWREQAERLDWTKFPTRIKDVDFNHNARIRWYEDGVLNVSVNCIDRHLATRGDQTAILWEGDEPTQDKKITYRELHRQVCKLANVLKDLDVRKGDRVTIYMPMIPETAYAMLACARIGAIHSVVFGGFSPDSLANRINDCDSKLVITTDGGKRGGRNIPLKGNTDEALKRCADDVQVLMFRYAGTDVAFNEGRDHDAYALLEAASADCPPEPMNAEDPLFILYTSGSTGKPKGVLHTTGGYLVYVALTHHYVFDYHDGDVYWCTADVGWVTGHSYIVYGPLANGATTLMFEGVPNYPTTSRFWEAWEWYYHVVGDDRCPIVDTWWQTETGGILITPLPGATRLKPGSATRPFFGVIPEIVDGNGKTLQGAAAGNLCIADAWPGIMRTVYGDHQRFVDTYFKAYPGKYFTGDGCRRDEDGYYWITGRVDDVINVAGHRMGTAEVESALVAHEKVSEAAVVGYPHDIKGQGIYAYVTLMVGVQPSDELRKELVAWVRKDIGPIASPDLIQFSPSLPKTRSGKIMRRILRKIAEDEFGALGDTSTLADPAVVDDLVNNRQNRKD